MKRVATIHRPTDDARDLLGELVGGARRSEPVATESEDHVFGGVAHPALQER